MPYSIRRYETVNARSLPRSYVCYDLETTGLGSDCRIIEVGAVRVIDGYEDEVFSSFVALPEGMCVSPGAYAVNHISDQMLVGAPTEAEVYAAFLDFVGELPLVGQNIVSFDNPFMDRAAERLGMPRVTQNGSHDTMVLYRRLVGRPSNLNAICAYYGIQNEEAHRAWADARATSDCYQAIIRDAASRSVDARDLSAEPIAHELDGQLLCFTGNTFEFPKRDCEILALEHGGKLHNGVTKRVTLLVDLEGRESAKVRKARQYGTAIVSGAAFLKMIGLAPEDLRRPPVLPR
ncbi:MULTISPECIES: exonuclease domain-containing protein [Atopobiaceae]|uniref:Exonuclease, DNA polymerase III, epsilon subunit family n=1 Tax=Parafannyhessea umbonata TaxID=604330 RepID=A0A1H9P456_9ACTN|nr:MULTISPECIES: exonuclease domain-containing protein [Atopobiaceae]SEH42532.1 exonuclease, DNA polymerase III, epsilon subunit family [Parafannyhessea umbonata]SER42996.1 exonuclease, DNA polymerase III, epsilon subunit family [Parafannyhessea umbonata]SJZ56663.1 exonuclease, DNA polymerase III, epsilon subunit family [Olsenella sp. KH1P3]